MRLYFAQVAQLVEQWIENPRVGGSIPPLGTMTKSLVSLTGLFRYSAQISLTLPASKKGANLRCDAPRIVNREPNGSD